LIALAAVVAPLAAVVFCALSRTARSAAASASLAVIALAVYALVTQPAGLRLAWAAPLGSTFAVALDPAGAILLATCGAVSLAAVAASTRVGDRRAYFALHCVALASAATALVARDLAAFFVGWESLLLAIAVLIRGWGAGDKRGASLRLLVHGLIGSGLFLVALASIAVARGTLDIDALAARPIAPIGQLLPALLFLAAFLPALAVLPFHAWSPRVHEAAPAGIGMLVPGLLAVVAGYGTLRICLGLFPQGMTAAAPVLVALAAVGALYGAIVAARQDDMRRAVAFLAVSQQSVAALALFVATPTSLRAAILLLVANALAMCAALVAIDAIARRTSSFLLSRGGGLGATAPEISALTTLTTLAAIGVPGSAGFAALVLALAGTYERYPAAAAVASLALALDAIWAALLLRRALHGPPLITAARDADWRERLVLVPLLAALLAIGVAPRMITDRIADGALPAVEAAP
jgi:NADH-quinone oxidoreductase subunit M